MKFFFFFKTREQGLNMKATINTDMTRHYYYFFKYLCYLKRSIILGLREYTSISLLNLTKAYRKSFKLSTDGSIAEDHVLYKRRPNFI